jgi:hypothetical protein
MESQFFSRLAFLVRPHWTPLELVLLEVAGDLVAEHGSLHVGSVKAQAHPNAGVDGLPESFREPIELAPRLTRGARQSARPRVGTPEC